MDREEFAMPKFVLRRGFLAVLVLLCLPYTIAHVEAATVFPADVLVVGSGSNNIAVFKRSGQLRSIVALPASSSQPLDIARAPNGEIFVSRDDGTVHRFDADLNLIGTWNWGISQFLYGITVGSDGLVYCSGTGASSVRIFAADGTFVRQLAVAGSTNLRDVEVIGNEVWVTNFTGPRIDVFNSSGTDVADLTAPTAPFGIHRAPNGDIWVAAQNSHELRRIDTSGATLLTFDADLGPFGSLSGQIRHFGIDPSDGRLFVSEYGGTRVDVYDGAGIYQDTLSDPSLSGPSGVVVIPLGSEIFSDGFESGNRLAW